MWRLFNRWWGWSYVWVQPKEVEDRNGCRLSGDVHAICKDADGHPFVIFNQRLLRLDDADYEFVCLTD